MKRMEEKRMEKNIIWKRMVAPLADVPLAMS